MYVNVAKAAKALNKGGTHWVQAIGLPANPTPAVFNVSITYSPLFQNEENHQIYYLELQSLDPSLHPILN